MKSLRDELKDFWNRLDNQVDRIPIALEEEFAKLVEKVPIMFPEPPLGSVVVIDGDAYQSRDLDEWYKWDGVTFTWQELIDLGLEIKQVH